jgi:flagellar basal-body rod protein FlgC
VEIVSVAEDTDAYKLVYDPENADANQDGYILYPNIDTASEIMDMMSASSSYQANVTVINAIKTMASSALQIGK